MKRDVLFVGVLFLLLSVLNVTALITLRDGDERRRYLDKVTRSSGLCTLETSGAVNSEQIPYTPEAIAAFYDECVRRHVREASDG